ncbi:universal stress protein [Alkalihalobacterium elongatum]|uniref:universal stress protein n=1 Tax=Alkalihalobacterium elongatum TaxID=2675466 RepID=UPI001C1FCE9F|nr:universal stress protein [Alkalihalobacterium elongatum]
MNTSKILVAYDGSETSKKALLKAKEIAEKNIETKVLIVTVWDLPNASYEAHNYHYIADIYKKEAEENIKVAEEMIQDLPNEKESFILKGSPSITLIEFAEKQDVNLIVLGNRGLGGIKRFFLGSVSFHVVQKASCDVYVVK